YDAFVSKVLGRPAAPVITSISTDSGSSSSDRITTDQTLSISGTADANVTVTLERADLGVLGSVSSSANGTWTYDYTSTTLTAATYDFIARATGSNGLKSDYSSPEFLVSVDLTAPTVTLIAPASTTSRGPEVRVIAQDQIGVPATATVTLDVDTDNDND